MIFSYFHRRSIDLKNGKRGKFTQLKDLYFPKGCGSLEFDLEKNSDYLHQQISPQARSFRSTIDDLDADDELIPAAQTLNQQFVPAPQQFNSGQVRRSGNKNDGFYYPDYSGRYIHDNRGAYIHDNRGLYVHIPGPDGPPAEPYRHVIGKRRQFKEF
jgi:hypothetical protein